MMSSKAIRKRDASRNIGEELLQAIRNVKSGKSGKSGAEYRVASARLKTATHQPFRGPRATKS